MIQINKLPKLPWSEVARKQMQKTDPNELLAMSNEAYQIGDVAVAGFIYRTLTAPPWFWFALAEGVSFGDLIAFRRLQERIPTGALTAVDKDNKVSRRFASFYGFVDTEHTHENYIIMRKK